LRKYYRDLQRSGPASDAGPREPIADPRLVTHNSVGLNTANDTRRGQRFFRSAEQEPKAVSGPGFVCTRMSCIGQLRPLIEPHRRGEASACSVALAISKPKNRFGAAAFVLIAKIQNSAKLMRVPGQARRPTMSLHERAVHGRWEYAIGSRCSNRCDEYHRTEDQTRL
jgi:hypothetical protein